MSIEMIREETPDKQAVNENWSRLRGRLLDEMGRGLTLTKLVRRLVDYGLHAISLRDCFNETKVKGVSLTPVEVECIRHWAECGDDENDYLHIQRYSNVPSQAEKIETALSLYFDDLDEERSTPRGFVPPRVITSVMGLGLEAIQLARKVCKPCHVQSVPGAGKSEFMREYIARARKAEGMNCPVWAIELGEWSVSSKAILMMIAEQVCPKQLDVLRSGGRNGPVEFELSGAIENASEGLGGVLIIDEANFLMDVPSGAGVRIINGLRRFCDRGLFGIVFLDNGELYGLDSNGKRSQLSSRFDNWRVSIPAPNEDDIELVMHAWGVSGREERKLCVDIGTQRGSLRNVTDCFRSALEQYGEITRETMNEILASVPTKGTQKGQGGHA